MQINDLIDRNTQALKERKAGDIIFFHPESLNPFARLILLVTGQYYHHGAIVIDENYIIEADPWQGVHIAEIQPYLSKYVLDLFRVKTEIDGNEIVNSAKKYLGWAYDYGNVVWAGIGFLWLRLTGLSIFRKMKNPDDENDAMHSEEYVDTVFRDIGVNLRPDIPTTNITAQDMADSLVIEKISTQIDLKAIS